MSQNPAPGPGGEPTRWGIGAKLLMATALSVVVAGPFAVLGPIDHPGVEAVVTILLLLTAPHRFDLGVRAALAIRSGRLDAPSVEPWHLSTPWIDLRVGDVPDDVPPQLREG